MVAQPFGIATWYRKHQQGLKPPMVGQSVPCDGCTACCTAVRVILYPPVDNPATYGHEVEPDGTLVLSKHPDGHCLYLHDGQCLIYHRRPVVCRTYDCRALLVTEVPHPKHVWEAAKAKFLPVFKGPDDHPIAERIWTKARVLEAQGLSPAEVVVGALEA